MEVSGGFGGGHFGGLTKAVWAKFSAFFGIFRGILGRSDVRTNTTSAYTKQ